MFDDLIRDFRAVADTAEALYEDSKFKFRSLIPSMEETALGTLLDNLEKAMDQTVEYSASQAERLREHLLENIGAHEGGRPVHIRIYEDGEVFVLDEDYAGTESDFEAADYGSTNPRRFTFWKYGIYKPAMEGYTPRKIKNIENFPTYDEIISERLSIWGPKAPYWYFVEFGNQGGGEPYPSFEGTFVFLKFREELQEDVSDFYDSFIDHYETRAAELLNESLETGTRRRPDSSQVIWIRLITSSGRAIWRPTRGNRFIPGVIYE